jgi:hypothetical protein
MWRTLGITSLVLGSALALAPQVASARDRDDYRNDRNRYEDRDYRAPARNQNRDRDEWRERQRGEGRNVRSYYNYGNGYRDNRQGYYDRYGYWHWY